MKPSPAKLPGTVFHSLGERAIGAAQVFDQAAPSLAADESVLARREFADDDDLILHAAPNARGVGAQGMFLPGFVGEVGAGIQWA